MRVDGDLENRSASVKSASVMSFRDGMPQREPMMFDTVEQLAGSMHDLSVGRNVAQSG